MIEPQHRLYYNMEWASKEFETPLREVFIEVSDDADVSIMKLAIEEEEVWYSKF